jgi:hypothetical protein
MANSLSGFQIVASNGLVNGEGIAPPNITANLSAYQTFAPVANFSNIYATSNTLPFGLTLTNANLLQSIGANSFPHVFGQVPNDFSSNLGSGPLFSIAPARTTAWFGNSSTANVYLQILGQAQNYAATAQAVVASAASTQWSGGPAASATGGFSSFAGNDPTAFQNVANVIGQLGTLMVPTIPQNGFSNADCFNRILEAGNDTIGNLHLTFFGNPIIDPTTGNTWVIGSELFSYILDNPVGLSENDTLQIVALNPFDVVLGQAADAALTQTGDLDAVITFFGLGANVAPQVYKWTDCLNIPLLLGTAVTQTISNALNLGVTPLDAYHFINGLITNIPGLTNLNSMTALGTTMNQIVPLTNSPALLAMSAPVSQSDFANVQATFGPGSGTNGNPTVDDVLGSTNYNQALSDTITGLTALTSSSHYANISADTTKISSALHTNTFPVTLSNGSSYLNINTLAAGGSTLVNQNALNLANIAPSLTNTSLFTAFNGIAETHNNSASLTALGSPFTNIAVLPIVTNALADFDSASGLIGMILSVIHKYYGASTITKIDNPPQQAMFQKIPGAPNFSPTAVLSSFPSSLASMASLGTQIPNASEITGLGNVTNCIDNTLTGQALSATIKEAQNAQALVSNGLISQALATNPTKLLASPTGLNTIGGGILK